MKPNIDAADAGLPEDTEKPRHINIDAAGVGLPAELQIRHYPNTKSDFLTYQIGIMGTRPEMQPVFGENNAVIGETKTGKTTTIYVLMAWGSSLKNAKEMFFSNIAKKEGIEK
jgi:hypothetical protein